MADQSMCKYFYIISSSLFICVAHFWDSVTQKQECEAIQLLFICYFFGLHFFSIVCNNTSPDIIFFIIFSPFAGWIFISDNTSHSNNHVNHYLQQIHKHYNSYYMQNDFGSISVLTVWAVNCSEHFKSRYQLGWPVLSVKF